ncbi:MAG: 4'-phosphopantetheinyl transferase superfamily protein [Bacteroidia bacterium]|nr:4'-phosphopantetheinyl transferase superfamily protein [Bacteroidia bacterium]NNF30440.1 4'-phosphopantetheinyl transferase superfamily protein [Flavobacteriaceae bacterium]MBT8275659.1 4'-phosphopantetheinyl transferase superfamily protein [Bacteroidia bacterium]NNJ82667.1 4'-phosphopantetheinyl transferase superfamily protein [Flavobacteriaceae bacterium]NNK54302.1 4'-phosphopantetheinyl transferase superfamily protein [Flavobacteriaceae bacterium]
MPLYKTITVNEDTKVLIWKIEESFDELSNGISLTENCRNRVDGMKSDLHRRGFMSIRHLLAEEGYTDHDLYYDENGKPHLGDDKHISITHSFIFSAIIISTNEVGIDIEKQRPKIIRIAHKFTPIEDYRNLPNDEIIMRKLTMVWGAKESLYKSFAAPGLSFLQHIYVEDFILEEMQTTAIVSFNGKVELYHVNMLEFEGFTCAYALLSKVV